MPEQRVTIKYIDSALAAKNGAMPISMGLGMALEYESKGWVKILNRPPQANPPVSPEEEIEFVKMPEEENLTKISWITANYIDKTLRNVAERTGFKVEQFTPDVFSPGHMLKVNLMLIESNLRGFTGNQLDNLRCIQFQKQIPFIFRIVGYDRSSFFKQNLVHSKLNIFTTEKIFHYTSELYEDLMDDWFIEEKGNAYDFWKKIDDVLNPKPIEFPDAEVIEKIDEVPESETIEMSDETLINGAAYTANQMKTVIKPKEPKPNKSVRKTRKKS